MGRDDIRRCGWAGVEVHNVEMGVLLSVWEEAGTCQNSTACVLHAWTVTKVSRFKKQDVHL